MTRCGIVTIAGKPNAGKSTLLNRMVGEHLAITSPKPQSTRARIVGILSDANAQLVLFDTPGLLDPDDKLRTAMRATAVRAGETAVRVHFQGLVEVVPFTMPFSNSVKPADYAARIVRLALEQGLPEETLLNVNVPNRTLRAIKGVQVTCLSRRRFDNPIIEKRDPHGREYFWIAGTRVSWSRSKHADHKAIEEGRVSVTPIHLDCTNYAVLDHFRAWEPMIQKQSVRSKPRAQSVLRRKG